MIPTVEDVLLMLQRKEISHEQAMAWMEEHITSAMEQARSQYVSPRQIVEQHRRHVELSPGAGEEVQKYALAVCDDILADLDAALISGGGA